jgi:hypothetical protein
VVVTARAADEETPPVRRIGATGAVAGFGWCPRYWATPRGRQLVKKGKGRDGDR